jgi:hypothetical protein
MSEFVDEVGNSLNFLPVWLILERLCERGQRNTESGLRKNLGDANLLLLEASAGGNPRVVFYASFDSENRSAAQQLRIKIRRLLRQLSLPVAPEFAEIDWERYAAPPWAP